MVKRCSLCSRTLLLSKFYSTGTKCRSCQHDLGRFGVSGEVILARDGYKCIDCGMTNDEHIEAWGRRLTIDHVDGQGRYSEVQNNDHANLRSMCLRCHGRKDKLRGLYGSTLVEQEYGQKKQS